MDSTESLLQTNSLLHESWQVVQDQVSSDVLTLWFATPSGACSAASLTYLLPCPLQSGATVFVIWC